MGGACGRRLTSLLPYHLTSLLARRGTGGGQASVAMRAPACRSYRLCSGSTSVSRRRTPARRRRPERAVGRDVPGLGPSRRGGVVCSAGVVLRPGCRAGAAGAAGGGGRPFPPHRVPRHPWLAGGRGGAGLGTLPRHLPRVAGLGRRPAARRRGGVGAAWRAAGRLGQGLRGSGALGGPPAPPRAHGRGRPRPRRGARRGQRGRGGTASPRARLFRAPVPRLRRRNRADDGLLRAGVARGGIPGRRVPGAAARAASVRRGVFARPRRDRGRSLGGQGAGTRLGGRPGGRLFPARPGLGPAAAARRTDAPPGLRGAERAPLPGRRPAADGQRRDPARADVHAGDPRLAGRGGAGRGRGAAAGQPVLRVLPRAGRPAARGGPAGGAGRAVDAGAVAGGGPGLHPLRRACVRADARPAGRVAGPAAPARAGHGRRHPRPCAGRPVLGGGEAAAARAGLMREAAEVFVLVPRGREEDAGTGAAERPDSGAEAAALLPDTPANP